MDLTLALIFFFGTSVLVVSAARFLVTSGDVIAIKTGWGHVWVGALLLAGATSLPELVATSTAAFLGNAGMAGGNVFGSNMLNMTILTLALGLLGGGLVLQKILPQQQRVAFFATLLTIVAVAFVAVKLDVKWWIVSPAALVILALYVAGSWRLFKQSADAEEEEEAATQHSLRWGWTVFALSSAVIFVATYFLTNSADEIADITGIGQSFIGVLALAFVTSLPEVSTSIAALRQNAPDLAVSNLFGSNSFNILVLAVADFFYDDGSIFGGMDNGALIAGLFAILIMSLSVWMLLVKRPVRVLSFTGPSMALITALYGAGLFLVFYLWLVPPLKTGRTPKGRPLKPLRTVRRHPLPPRGGFLHLPNVPWASCWGWPPATASSTFTLRPSSCSSPP